MYSRPERLTKEVAIEHSHHPLPFWRLRRRKYDYNNPESFVRTEGRRRDVLRLIGTRRRVRSLRFESRVTLHRGDLVPILSELDWMLHIDACYNEIVKPQRFIKDVVVNNTLFCVVKIILLLATELPKEPS